MSTVDRDPPCFGLDVRQVEHVAELLEQRRHDSLDKLVSPGVDAIHVLEPLCLCLRDASRFGLRSVLLISQLFPDALLRRHLCLRERSAELRDRASAYG